jgi:hypothetical protein
MRDLEVDPATLESLYRGVRLFGQSAWDDNARLRNEGEKRILKRFPTKVPTHWQDWKKLPDVF